MEPDIEVKEVFLDFKKVGDIRGQTLYDEIVKFLARTGLPLGKLRSICSFLDSHHVYLIHNLIFYINNQGLWPLVGDHGIGIRVIVIKNLFQIYQPICFEF